MIDLSVDSINLTGWFRLCVAHPPRFLSWLWLGLNYVRLQTTGSATTFAYALALDFDLALGSTPQMLFLLLQVLVALLVLDRQHMLLDSQKRISLHYYLAPLLALTPLVTSASA